LNLSLDPTWLAPRFEFVIPTPEGDLPASIDVGRKAWAAGDTRGLRLTVSGEVIYAEGCFWQGERDLPIPAHAPAPAVNELPLPADAPTLKINELPIPVPTG